jgi:polyhydroxyalkanoate synthesis repressor PhaR
MAILIKRYANRKLYNTDTSRYITLKGISELLSEGQEVRVVDNETGEDITNVALSQILVDSERSNSAVPRSLLSQIMERGGDIVYGALKRGMDDAQDNIGEIQDRMRKIVRGAEGEGERLRDWIALSPKDFDRRIQKAMERVFKLLDLPRRTDLEMLNANLERVAEAIERLEGRRRTESPSEPTPSNPSTGTPEDLAPPADEV